MRWLVPFVFGGAVVGTGFSLYLLFTTPEPPPPAAWPGPVVSTPLGRAPVAPEPHLTHTTVYPGRAVESDPNLPPETIPPQNVPTVPKEK